MITLKLTHGLSHDNGYVRATEKHPFVTVEDEAIAQYCVDSGFFEIVKGAAPHEETEAPAELTQETAKPDSALDPQVPDAGVDHDFHEDDEELEAMTVAELRAYAETTGVDLGKLTKKADIINAIRKAEAE